MPVVLATVGGRSVLAQDNTSLSGSGCASMHPSGWLMRDGDVAYQERLESCEAWQENQLAPLQEPVSEPEPVFNFDPEPVEDPTKGGNGWGKGGKPK